MKRLYLITAAGIALLIISFFFDNQILDFIFSLNLGFLKIVMVLLDHWVTNAILFLVIPTIILFRKRNKLIFLWLSLVLSFLVATILKILVARERPDLALISEDTFSFPSRHAIIAFTILPFMFKETRSWYWWIIAIFIGLSRLILGIHYLSDVIAGALIGYYIGYFLLIFYKKRKILL